MFGDLDWPLDASRGLSAIAEFLVKLKFITRFSPKDSAMQGILLECVDRIIVENKPNLFFIDDTVTSCNGCCFSRREARTWTLR